MGLVTMNNDVGEERLDDAVLDTDDEFDEDDDGEEFVDTVILSETSLIETVDDTTAEVNVEKLIADIEKSDAEEVAHKKEVRLRLEEFAEQRSLEDTYAFEFDKD